ncbi:uncharacterized protein [Spinacia oleracea]|uniref:Uncharacterized protein isoform X2 n=1 Tax=Spinacia oleracea TaxID=3562 RepID=A0ABM3RB05_SPIOL|nr:uncharacterized protein LOC110778054 isoform X2 [Spinacia oleracea]
MNYKLLSLKYRFHKLLRSDVAWKKQIRLFGTAAPREIPNMSIRTGRRISPNERRAIVEEFVNKYRMLNAGKFPTALIIRRQVGGNYYNNKAILQELEYSSKLPTVPTAANIPAIKQTAQVNCTSDAGVNPDCQVSGKDNRTAVVDKYDTSAECYSSYNVDKKSDQKMVDMLSLNKHEISAEYSGSENKVELKLVGQRDIAFADMDMSDNSRISESVLPGTLNVAENTVENETLIAMTMDDSGSPAKPGHPSEVTGISRNPKPEIDKASGQDFESDELTRCRVTHVGKFSTATESKKQFNDPDSATIEELDTVIVGGEVNNTFDVENTLDCQMRLGRIVTVNDDQVSAENDSSSQKAVDEPSCQKMINTSNVIKMNEVATEDVCRSGKMATMSVKAKETEDCESFAKPSHPSEVSKTWQNTETGESDEASAQASKCDEKSRRLSNLRNRRNHHYGAA